MVSWRALWSIAFTAVLATAGDSGAQPAARPVLVELYTSQSCSDCPPADRLMSELAGRDDVVALSFHITYLDMLGWKDTLAIEANTRRQQAYARTMHRRGTYTPQMIIEGVEDLVGNHREEVLRAVADHAARVRAMAPVQISISREGDDIHIGVEGERDGGPATVWVMHTLSRAEVTIAGGENRGDEMVYHNVVRDLRDAGTWLGGAQRFTLPELKSFKPYDGIAVVVQSAGLGAVLGVRLVPMAALTAP